MQFSIQLEQRSEMTQPPDDNPYQWFTSDLMSKQAESKLQI